jgi:hypothetical protein
MKKKQKTSFAEMVQSAADSPARQRQPRLHPGRHESLLLTRDLKRWKLVEEPVDPDLATRLVADGAFLAHDACGCGGTCGIELIDTAISRELPEIGRPEISTDPRHPGALSYWIAEEDPKVALVLASGRVRWGRALGA